MKASHAAGKTFAAAILANWYYDCWPEHIVYVTAPTWSQALGLTFKQIKRFRLQKRLPGEILDSGLVRDTDRLRSGGHYIKALNAASGEGFQGEHTAPVLVILEEAVGVPAYIWEAAGGLMTAPECRLLVVGNPTDESTEFGLACATPSYHVITIPALRHPNIQAELQALPPPYPGAVRLQWIYEMLQTECEPADTEQEDHFRFWSLPSVKLALEGVPVSLGGQESWYRPNAVFQGRVLGVFPTQADEQVIPRGWLEALQPLPSEDRLPEIGCDVARFGSDRTTICTRRGPHVLALRELRQMDTVLVAEALRQAAAQAAEAHNKTAAERTTAKQIALRIDVTGGLGAGPFDMLRAEGYRVVPVNASSHPNDREKYLNRRSEMWFTMRDRVRERRLDLSPLPREMREALIREFATPKYSVDGGGKKVVEPKDRIKARLGASPDLADAANMAFTDLGRWWQDPELAKWFRESDLKPATGKAEPVDAPAQTNLLNLMKGG